MLDLSTRGRTRPCLMPSAKEIVETYLSRNYRIIVWPRIGDTKGPREADWPRKIYTLADYKEGYRVGLLTGVEVSPGRFLHDVDIDWSPGMRIAQRLLPPTAFAFGRSSKKLSHCIYLLPEALPSYRYEDIDKTCLIEYRGTKVDGELGLQTMVPPSVWSKDNSNEDLEFVKFEEPAFTEPGVFKQSVCLSAIGMLLAKHFGKNGFGHEARLCWAGFLLRADIDIESLIIMGEAISHVTNNTEVGDVRRVVESTASRLSSDKNKIKGGPALTRCLGLQGKAVIARINEWLGRDSDFIRDKDGIIVKNNQENIKRAAELMGFGLTLNEFSEKIYYNDNGVSQSFNKHTTDRLWLRLDREHHFRPEFSFFDKVVRDVAYSNSYHPVRDYFATLTWDGKPRINNWLTTYGGAEDTIFLRAVSAMVLIAATRRIFSPGCKFDEMLVLESPQGMNKSTALRALCPKDDWFSDDLPLNVDAKQIIERTLGKWIIESSDLTGGRKADRDALKSMLSRQVDGPARMAYAHDPVERPRHFIIIGTTNSAAYLADMTGARRFLPCKIKRFDIEGITRDRDQLWAEARAREQAGESIRLPEELWLEAENVQESRREHDAWEEVITDSFVLLKPASSGRIQVSTEKLWDLLGIQIAHRDRLGAMRISEIMQKNGFIRTKIRIDGKVQAGYIGQTVGLDLEGEDVELV